jgi:hypothetical protein
MMTSSKIDACRGENPKRVGPESTLFSYYNILYRTTRDSNRQKVGSMLDDELKSDLSQQRLKRKRKECQG